MGPKLRRLVEEQLSLDLRNYKIYQDQINFDWSESCIEGHDLELLDGSVENFSNISVYDNDGKLIAEGWMDFVYGGDFFMAFWELIKTLEGDKKIAEKKEFGIPKHIWKQIPDNLQSTWEKKKIK